MLLQQLLVLCCELIVLVLVVATLFSLGYLVQVLELDVLSVLGDDLQLALLHLFGGLCHFRMKLRVLLLQLADLFLKSHY
jgi:hypothetical protein